MLITSVESSLLMMFVESSVLMSVESSVLMSVESSVLITCRVICVDDVCRVICVGVTCPVICVDDTCPVICVCPIMLMTSDETTVSLPVKKTQQTLAVSVKVFPQTG